MHIAPSFPNLSVLEQIEQSGLKRLLQEVWQSA